MINIDGVISVWPATFNVMHDDDSRNAIQATTNFRLQRRTGSSSGLTAD
jgi:hypothetical protein